MCDVIVLLPRLQIRPSPSLYYNLQAMRYILALLISMTPLIAPKGVTVEPWGKTSAGEYVELYTLTNASGGQARIATYGGVVVSLTVPR